MAKKPSKKSAEAGLTKADVVKMVDAKLKVFEAELVAAKCIQPRPE